MDTLVLQSMTSLSRLITSFFATNITAAYGGSSTF
jgi:hypothetical protein